MKLDVKCRIRNRAWQRLAILTEGLPLQAVKTFGTIYVRAMAASTPPHTLGSPASVLSAKKHADILAAQKRVAQNIAGVDSPAEVQPNVRPVKMGADAWQFTYIGSHKVGEFGMLVPDSWRAQGGENPPESTPKQIYGTPRWEGRRMVPSRPFDPSLMRSGYTGGFVRAKALRSFIAEKQKHVGKLISGWAPAARVFATGKGIAPGFFASLGGKGFGRIFKNKKGGLCGLAINRQPYSPQQLADIRRRVPQVMRASRKACEAQLEHIKKWYIRNAKKALAAK